MSEAIDQNRLHGRWIHSDDEDHGGRLVLRASDFPFPPRRMPRADLSIKPGGAAVTGSPGPADRNTPSSETWTLDGDELTISGATGLSGRFQVVAVDEQTLILQRLSRESESS